MSATVERTVNSKVRWTEFVLFAAVFSVLALFVTRYVARERFIYFWDYVQYHNFYMILGQGFLLDPLRALTVVFRTIRREEYNLLPALFLVPFRLLFGPGRLAYILSITVTYVFPSIILFWYVVRKLARSDPAQNTFDEVGMTLLSVMLFAFLPILWVPVLLGSVDVGGLIIISVVLLVYFGAELAEQTLGRVAAMALLLCLLVMYRRWYAYWVVGFFGAMAVCELWRCATKNEWRTRCIPVFKNAFLLGAIFLCSLFVIATPIAWRMLTTNYRDIYSGYRSSHPFLHNSEALYQHFGLLTLLLAGLGVLVSVMNERRRPIAYFLVVQFVITFVFFARTQDFVISSRGEYVGVQHFYWAIATLALFSVFFLQNVFLRVRTRLGKAALLAVIVAGSLANFSATFMPRANQFFSVLNFAFPRAKQFPILRTDLDQVQALLNTLNDLSKEPGSTVYVLASSFILNSSVAQEGCFFLQQPHYELAHKIATSSDVDKRDGFPVPFLKARYVVLTIPFAYHLAPQDQKVIGVLAQQIVGGEGIGTSYEKLNYEFTLEDGSRAFIYKKVRPLDPAAVKALSDEFVGFYPMNRDKFQLSPDVIREASAL